MNLKEYLKGLKRRTKDDDIPGTLLRVLDEKCPLCERNLKLMKACCGSPYGLKECRACNYKINLTSDSDGGNS